MDAESWIQGLLEEQPLLLIAEPSLQLANHSFSRDLSDAGKEAAQEDRSNH